VHWFSTTQARRADPFKTPEGKAAFLAAYDAGLKLWPVPYEERDIPTRFGSTRVIVSGSKAGPPLVLLHGHMATSTMWLPNVADFARDYRVYAVDVMGQASRSIPDEPVRDSRDYVEWLTLVLDELGLDRIFLVGMSFGGWLAGKYAIARPYRVHKLVLLSAGGFLPMVKQFSLRGMLMVCLPTRFTVNSFMHWLGIGDESFLRLLYLGLKHFRMPPETARIMPTVFPDFELRGLRVPTLVLFGEHEVIYDPVAALARARRFMPAVEGALIPGCSHDMSSSQHEQVDARVLAFLKKPGEVPGPAAEARITSSAAAADPAGSPSQAQSPAATTGSFAH